MPVPLHHTAYGQWLNGTFDDALAFEERCFPDKLTRHGTHGRRAGPSITMEWRHACGVAAKRNAMAIAQARSSMLFEQLVDTDTRIERLTGEIETTQAQNETSQRLATIPGVGLLSATIIAATTPDVGNFDCARDYAAWLGLTPKPHSTGGKQRIGRISKMGNRYIRRLLYLGAMSQIMVRRRCGLRQDWQSDMLARKKTKVAAIALAHRMARTIFAVLRDGSRYQPQATTA